MFKAYCTRFSVKLKFEEVLLDGEGDPLSIAYLNAVEKMQKFSKHQVDFARQIRDSSSYICSFNMQGVKNGAYTVKDYCKTKSPLIVGLQETKCPPNAGKLKKMLNVPGYRLFQSNADTALLTREDVKIIHVGDLTELSDVPHDFIKFKTQDGDYSLLNVYIRSNALRDEHLKIFEKLGPKSFILGDFNAKHQDLLPALSKM
jgi:hypothetical protein